VKLSADLHYLEHNGYIAVLHSYFCGAPGATPSAFENFDDFKAYLAREAKPGDIIDVWPFPAGKRLFSGKIPNEKGHWER